MYAGGSGLKVDPALNFPSTATPMSTNLLRLYHCDDDAASTDVIDSSGNGGTGLLVGGANTADITTTGKIANPGAAKEINVLQSRDGITDGEYGAVELGDDNVRATINGKTLRFNVNSTEKLQIDASGNLKIENDNQKIYLGTADDSSIYYDGTDLVIDPKEVGSGKVYINGNVSASFYIGNGSQLTGIDTSNWDRTGTVLKPLVAGDEVHIENPTESETFEIKKVDLNALTTLKDNVFSVADVSPSFQFDGTNDYVRLDTTNLLNGGTALTFSA